MPKHICLMWFANERRERVKPVMIRALLRKKNLSQNRKFIFDFSNIYFILLFLYYLFITFIFIFFYLFLFTIFTIYCLYLLFLFLYFQNNPILKIDLSFNGELQQKFFSNKIYIIYTIRLYAFYWVLFVENISNRRKISCNQLDIPEI